ncbi:hypothetical protein JNUCC0626_18160 [Lentzea sp. JNUCC 0626]|uniref:hypothetical protein n=1 Tax=Lentzea sp. JNUCC 0626 TaxID=3367513 RepID=UPI00374901DD
MTNISVRRKDPFQSEDRSWLAGPHGTEPGTTPTVTLDVSAFPAGNGYIRSGTPISKLASGLWGPFDAAAASGQHGLLFGSLRNDQGDVAGAAVVHAFVYASKLPGGTPANLAALKTALPLIHFYA